MTPDTEAEASAQACIAVARLARKSKDDSKAMKFLEKSLRFHVTPEATQMVEDIRNGVPSADPPSSSSSSSFSSTTTTTTSSSSSSSSSTTTPSKASAASSSASSSSSSTTASEASYTAQQQADAKKINKLKDLYAILGLSREADEKEIKAAYRKMALAFHPDKNQAPAAEAAFKSINNAYSTLSDAKKRLKYDQYGAQDMDGGQSAGMGGFANWGNNETAVPDLTPEEIFSMFFQQNGEPHPFKNNNNHSSSSSSSSSSSVPSSSSFPPSFQSKVLGVLRRLSPLLFVLLFHYISPGSTSTPFFSFVQTEYYDSEVRFTPLEKTPYYVSSASFDLLHAFDPRALASTETSVDQAYIKYLKLECNNERAKTKKAEEQPHCQRFLQRMTQSKSDSDN